MKKIIKYLNFTLNLIKSVITIIKGIVKSVIRLFVLINTKKDSIKIIPEIILTIVFFEYSKEKKLIKT
ncbi:hypothetical protein [Fusobacterium varium]|uniref:hypothetical protein n=1 Tax=Fusobacterium varium TaxID=856 RepID=UPI001FD2CDA3|nr:hypothetical protein [Fusobacterium varium]